MSASLRNQGRLSRRGLLKLSASTGTAVLLSGRSMSIGSATANAHGDLRDALRDLERRSLRHIGVRLQDTRDGSTFSHRGHERFAQCSTHKVFTVACVLAHVGDLDDVVRYSAADLVEYSPVTSQHVAEGMTLYDLCAAALQVSDNTAANLLSHRVGGPRAVTRFLRCEAGDTVSRVDHVEPEVNAYEPGRLADTTTPAAIATTYGRLAEGGVLRDARADLLRGWMLTCQTGLEQIRSVAPDGWEVADKTGSGSDYGTTNDVAVLWPPRDNKPVRLAVLTRSVRPEAENQTDVVREAARIALAAITT